MKLLKQLIKDKKVSPPSWLSDNMLYANVHGSQMYGCSLNSSDQDIYGVVLPPLSILFPHTAGWIQGFESPISFEVWQQHHVDGGYDFSVHNITKFLHLAMQGNPNITECLFAPQDCILHKTTSFQLILDIKQEFLTQRSIPRYRGYMVSQLHKMKTKTPDVGSTRLANFEKYGYDVKFASHLIRLGLFCEQILKNRWLDLRQDAELLKSIKRGELKLREVEDLAQSIISRLEKLQLNTTLPIEVNKEKVKRTLINVIESHYGSIDKLVKLEESEADKKLALIRDILWK